MKTDPHKTDPFQIVFDRYQELTDLYAPSATSILKTDCFNEIDRPVITHELQEKTILVEYNASHISKAKEKNPNLTIFQGDIRYPFFDLIDQDNHRVSFGNHFDLILDFSTIDHVPQPQLPLVFENYYHMMKEGGTLVIVAWFNKDLRTSRTFNGDTTKDWNSTDQYFFDYGEFVIQLRRFFTIESNEVIADERTVPAPKDCYIREFICQKNY